TPPPRGGCLGSTWTSAVHRRRPTRWFRARLPTETRRDPMKRTAAAALLLLLTSACVTKGTYEALQTEHDATLDQLKARNATIRDREKELEAAQANTRDLERALEDEK